MTRTRKTLDVRPARTLGAARGPGLFRSAVEAQLRQHPPEQVPPAPLNDRRNEETRENRKDSRGFLYFQIEGLQREVGERLVGVGHAMGLVAGVHGFAFLAVGRQEFVRQALGHRSSALIAAGIEKPAKRQRLLTLAVHLHRHLIVGATDAGGCALRRTA